MAGPPEGHARQEGPALHRRAAELFEQARHLDGEARAELIARSAAGDDDLRAEVERLLAHADPPAMSVHVAAALAREATALLADEVALALERGESPRLGRYRLLRMLGRGGMGTVFEAEQERPRRRVALKVIRFDLLSPEARRRFERETEVLGRLTHPGIATILEAGTLSSPGQPARPFFAMELVEGLPLLEHARRHDLGTSERLELLARIADAVQHAHRKGVVHRDLKPDNILVQQDGQAKVLDFGVARATDSDLRSETLQTTAGEILGTVPYMSPEQVAGRTEEIDARSDVYSLGVIAYELISQRKPYRLERLALPEAARVIREDEPSQLGTLGSQWRGDVETIVGKALEKDRERRYQSAADLAEDIRRHLRQEPIAARPPSTLYHLTKFARRNKALVGGVIGVFLALAAGTVVSTRFAWTASRQHELAEQREQQALRQAYRASLAAAQAALREGEASVRQHLADAPEALRGWEWHVLAGQLDRSVRTVSSTPAGGTVDLAISSDGRTLTTVSVRDDGSTVLEVDDVLSGARLRSAELSVRPVRTHSDDLALARRHATFAVEEIEIEYVDAATGARLALDRRCGDVASAASLEATWGDLGLVGQRICDLRAGRTVSTVAGSKNAAFSPDGRLVALPRAEVVELREVATGRLVGSLRDGLDDARAVFFVLGGDGIATVSWNGYLRLWDPVGSRLVEKHRLSTSVLIDGDVSSDGSMIAVVGNDPRVHVWDLREGREIAAPRAVGGSVALGDDGRWLAVRGQQTVAQVFDHSGTRALSVLRGHESYVYPALFGWDGDRLYSGSWDGTLRIWDAETREPIATLDAGFNVQRLSLNADGRRLVGSDTQSAATWNVETGRRLAVTHEAGLVEWREDGTLRGGIGSPVREWQPVLLDPDSLEILGDAAPPAGTRSPDGAWVAHAGAKGRLVIRSARDGTVARELEGEPADMRGRDVTWSPDGSRLVAGFGTYLNAWSVPDWTRLASAEAHARRVQAMAFSPDGRRLATGGGDGVVRLWEGETMQPLLQLRGHDSYVWTVAWSPDGTRLVSSSGDGTLRVWDSVPLGDRWRAREKRRRLVRELRPIVEAVFDEVSDAAAAVSAVRARTAGESARYRRAALDVALQVSLARGDPSAFTVRR